MDTVGGMLVSIMMLIALLGGVVFFVGRGIKWRLDRIIELMEEGQKEQ